MSEFCIKRFSGQLRRCDVKGCGKIAEFRFGDLVVCSECLNDICNAVEKFLDNSTKNKSFVNLDNPSKKKASKKVVD